MALRLPSEEYTAYFKKEQTEDWASTVWKLLVKNQAQCIFHYCKYLSSGEKHSNCYQYSFDAFRLTRCFTGFVSSMQEVLLYSTGFPSFPT